MDTFTGIVVVSLLLTLLTFLALGWIWRGRPAEEITDRKRYEKWGTQMAIEQRELPQMIAAANDYRRKRGKPEVSLEDFKHRIGDEQLRILEEADKQMRAHEAQADQDRARRGF